MQNGDVAGLALLNLPYAWIGVVQEHGRRIIRFFDQQKEKQIDVVFEGPKVLFQAHCNFDTDYGTLSYSLDGQEFIQLGDEILMPYQLRTFQGVRYALFHFNQMGVAGGFVDFNHFHVEEPRYQSFTRPIPIGKTIMLKSVADGDVLVNWRNFLRPVDVSSNFAGDDLKHFNVLDRGNGRVALQSVTTGGYVTVKGHAGLAEVRIEAVDQGAASTFQWQDMLDGSIMLMSLYNHRYVFVDPEAGSLCSADARGARPDRKGGACFIWEIID